MVLKQKFTSSSYSFVDSLEDTLCKSLDESSDDNLNSTLTNFLYDATSYSYEASNYDS